ncbi:MAG TPA: hypothetical protein VLF64_00120 [Candidatus Saccharimonadales bacterium]|nr:hypothetical protein [Candidatus Chromulinivoraceae bacterium]HSW90384.1 hypothetical protein [Candidatus Saccharimonadales bacterium]
MSEVIEMARSAEVFDDTTAGQLNERLADKTVEQLGATKFELAKQLGTMPNAFKVAGTLLDFMREAELIGNTTPAAPAQPMAVTVVMPTKRSDMGLGELFNELTEHPEDADELVALIGQQNSVQQANAKLHGSGEWAIPNEDGLLNVAETLEYVRHLAAKYTQPQRKWKSQYWPTTLERALGRDQRIMLYPFATGAQNLLLVGPDRFGNDWSKLSDNVHEAVIHAVTRHILAVNNETDTRRVTHELFSDELPAYLRDIVEDYEQGKARGVKVERYATPEQLQAAGLDVDSFGSRHPFGAEPEHDDAWYEARLREVALAPINKPNGDIRKSRCVLTSVSAAHGDVRLDNVIVLGFVQLAHGDLEGTFYMPSRRSPSLAHGDDDSIVRDLPWKRLYAKAQELGLI